MSFFSWEWIFLLEEHSFIISYVCLAVFISQAVQFLCKAYQSRSQTWRSIAIVPTSFCFCSVLTVGGGNPNSYMIFHLFLVKCFFTNVGQSTRGLLFSGRILFSLERKIYHQTIKLWICLWFNHRSFEFINLYRR